LFALIGVAAFLFTSSQNDQENSVFDAQDSSQADASNSPDIMNRLELVDGESKSAFGVIVFYEQTGRYIVLPPVEKSVFVASVTQKDPENPVTNAELRTYYSSELIRESYEQFEETNSELIAYDTVNNILRFKDGSVVCALGIPGQDEDVANFVSKSCSDTTSVQETAEGVEEFYVAYEKAAENSDEPYLLSVQEKDAVPSDITGYSYVYGSVGGLGGGGANVTFLREDSGPWVFFMARQDMLSCDMYVTELARKALAHETCLDGSAPEGQNTVKNYYDL
jgi:hypothetical protein